ncbi:MAG: hypothetical protein IKM46_03915 [Clostridia bacterium]|nr:hypothetical protein [Clostridia bacterium]
MSKKLLSLFLCLLMFVSPILTACGSDDDAVEGADAAEATRKPMTLSLWLPTSSETSQKSIDQVEAALNSLLAAKYDTNIELNLIPEDEYDEKLDAHIKQVKKTREDAQKAADKAHKQLIKDVKNCLLPSERDSVVNDNVDKSKNEAYTKIDEYGQKVTVYPEVADDQLDIFLVKGYENYLNYIEDELIVSIDEEMSTVGASMYNYIYPTFFDVAKYDGSLYCVPNNHALDDYEYLLVNKELADLYNYSGDELTDIIKCESFIKDVYTRINAEDKDENEAAILENVTPLLGTCEAPNMIYIGSANKDKNDHTAWSYDNWSIVATSIGSGISFNSKDVKFSIVTEAGSGEVTYGNIYGLMRRLQSVEGMVGDGVIDEGEKFAVGVVEGGAELKEVYGEDYYMNIHAVPLADTDDVFGSDTVDGSVFCVSSYTKDASRAVEVITMLNTNEEFRTILQYGINGVHWSTEKDAEGNDVLKVLSDDYKMNLTDTGNVYLTYPEAGVPKSFWNYAKEQNLDSSCNPFIGFTFDEWYESKTPDEISQKNLTALQKKSTEVYKLIEEATFDLETPENDSVDGILGRVKSEYFNGAKDANVAVLQEFALTSFEKVDPTKYIDTGKINDTIVSAFETYAMSKG